MYNFPYLNDTSFLRRFDKTKLKQQLVKIVVLNFSQQPIQEIQGKVTGGSLSLNGDSAMRRTCSLSMVADVEENNLTDTKYLLSINKKIEVLVGFINTTGQYQDYPVLWFPQGVYLIITPNISLSNSGINISLTLHDKMALLNGECGGTLPASMILHETEDIDAQGNTIIKQLTIRQIISQLVHHFGGQQLGKIIINDLDDRARKVMKWTGDAPIYHWKNGQSHFLSTNYNEYRSLGQPTQYDYGSNIGYILTDLVYPGELISKPGDTIVSILDQIKNTLGNYEYFYDINGNFIFQQIKNYLNKSYSTFQINQMNRDNYLVDYTNGKSVYTFEDSEIITAVSNTPQFQQIKNDFVVWGKRKTISGTEVPIRYHLAIDDKPTIRQTYDGFYYVDPDDEITKVKAPIKVNTLPTIGMSGEYYLCNNKISYFEDGQWVDTDYVMTKIQSTDFRSALYLDGMEKEPLGLESNYYYAELKNEWPKLYDLKSGSFYSSVLQTSDSIDYFLDFIDADAALAEFSVKNIGRRTMVISDDKINCIFEPTMTDLVIIEEGTSQTTALRTECENKRQQYVQVDSGIYNMLVQGGTVRSAYEQIKNELYQYTSYNEQVSLTALPIYYLQPNIRITIINPQTGINGDYMIKSLTLPFDINSTMNITCIKALQRW